MIGGSGWEEGSLPWAGACMLELLVGTEEGAPRLSCQLTWVCVEQGQRGTGGAKSPAANITDGLNSVSEPTHAFRWDPTFLGRCTVPRVRLSQTSH